MHIAKIVQAVVLLTIVALAASCTATKQYASKLFPNKEITEKDTQAVALRFLELDGLHPKEEDLVTTDIIMGRDTVSKTLALDNLAKVYPAITIKKDTSSKTINTKEVIIATTKKTSESEIEEPIAKSVHQNGVREKKTRDD